MVRNPSSVELEDLPESTNPSVVGIDVGIKSIAVASDGTVFQNPTTGESTKQSSLKHSNYFPKKQARSNRKSKALLELQRYTKR